MTDGTFVFPPIPTFEVLMDDDPCVDLDLCSLRMAQPVD